MLCFSPFLRIFKLEFLIQDLISRLIMNENGICISKSKAPSTGIRFDRNRYLFQGSPLIVANGGGGGESETF